MATAPCAAISNQTLALFFPSSKGFECSGWPLLYPPVFGKEEAFITGSPLLSSGCANFSANYQPFILWLGSIIHKLVWVLLGNSTGMIFSGVYRKC